MLKPRLLSIGILCLSFPVTTTLAQDILYDNTSGGPVVGPQLDPGDRYLAQPFLSGESGRVSSVTVNLDRRASRSGQISLSLWDEDAGKPNELIAPVCDIDGSTLSGQHEFVTCDTSVDDLNPDSTYYVVLDTVNASLPLGFGVLNDNDGTYGAGKVMVHLGGNWVTVDSVLGPNPETGERANYWQMAVGSSPLISTVALYDNMDLEPIENIPGAIGPRFISNQEDAAQQFLVGEHTNVSSVSLFLNKVGAPTGEVKVEIWEDREPGVPSSLVTTVGTIDLAELPTDRTEVTFDTLVTGLTPDRAYHLVLNNLDTSIASAQDSYRTGVLGNINDPQTEGTNGAAFMLGSSPEEFNGAWTPVLETLGCHPPSGGCPNFLRMTVSAATLLGDFDEDGQLDADDIDALSLEIRNGDNDRSFDLDNSATLTADDHAIWVEQLAGTFVGDTNLDGEVDFPDFLALSAGFGQPGGWSEGDMDGNGQVEFPDFLALSANFGQSSVVAASVPEPSSLCLLSLGLIVIVRIRRFVSREVM